MGVSFRLLAVPAGRGRRPEERPGMRHFQLTRPTRDITNQRQFYGTPGGLARREAVAGTACGGRTGVHGPADAAALPVHPGVGAAAAVQRAEESPRRQARLL